MTQWAPLIFAVQSIRSGRELLWHVLPHHPEETREGNIELFEAAHNMDKQSATSLPRIQGL